MKSRSAFLSVLLLCGGSTLLASAAPTRTSEAESESKKNTTGVWATVPDPDLPNVLILGDSISIGYTLQVRELLAGTANVFRPHTADGKRPQNCAGTTAGIQHIDRWLEGRRYDVIHFNWGLHDLKHVKPETRKNSNSFMDPRQAEPEVYRKNLTEIVASLKATKATLIFGTTTPYPDGVKPARLPADVQLYNDIALEIMQAHQIKVNDLCSFARPRLKEMQQPVNVHFNDKGSRLLAAQVATAIEGALR